MGNSVAIGHGEGWDVITCRIFVVDSRFDNDV